MTIALILLAATAAAQPQPIEVTPMRSADLSESVTRARWLSLPHSRLVVNPRFAGYGPDPVGGRLPDSPLALDLAYYVGEEPVRLPGFWSWQLPQRERHESTPLLEPAQRDRWTPVGVEVRDGDGGASVVPIADYGSIDREVTVDLDRTPLLFLEVPSGTGKWALKVSDGKADDVTLIGDTADRGQFIADIAQVTGWRGKRTFTIKFFGVGRGQAVTLAHLRLASSPKTLRPTAGGTSWTPHAIASKVASRDGTMEAESTLAFHDTASIGQRLKVTSTPSGPLMLTGTIAKGSARWDAERDLVLLSGDGYQAAIAVSRPVRWLGTRPTSLDWSKAEPAPNQGGTAGTWALGLDGVRAGDEIVVSARFSPSGAGILSELNAVRKLARRPAFGASVDRQRREWDRWLAKVPRPADFTIRSVDSLGVTPADVRRNYYGAWAFLIGGILPPMPENGYPFPQLPTGKPSLWNEGAPGARPSAQWESFVAMQSLVHIDPGTAWRAFEGMMNLVGADGSMNGEGLPSCHAQTAWTLYEATGDVKRLRRTYPALRRLLLWKASDPRWIYKGSTPPGQKDQQFVLYALMDMGYAERIARKLGMPDEGRFWRERRSLLERDFHRWFWETPGGPSYRLYEATTGKRSGEDAPWNFTTLALPPAILSAAERGSLVRAFQRELRPNLPFVVRTLSRFADYEGTQRGLFQYGYLKEASILADAAIRDVARAGEFSEVYDQDAPSPKSAGVRPSTFGARHAIDGVMWHNGVVYDEGMPVLLGTGQVGGVSGLRVRGERIDITFGERGLAVLSGPGLRHTRMPDGFVARSNASGKTEWAGVIRTGQQIRLQQRGEETK